MKQKPADLVPQRLSDFPAYVAARQRYEAIKGDRERNDAERQSILDRLARRADTSDGNWLPSAPVMTRLDMARIVFVEPDPKPLVEPDPSPTEANAQAVLDGTVKIGTLTPDNERQTLQEGYDVLVHQLRVLVHAEKLAQRALLHETRVASTAISKSIRPEYKKLVERLGAALVALAEVATFEMDVRDFLAGEEIILEPSLVCPMPFGRVGRIDDPDSPVALWLQEARDLGYAVPAPPVRR